MTEIRQTISSDGFEVVAGSTVQTLKVTFRPPVDLPLNAFVSTYAVVAASQPFESADCEVIDAMTTLLMMQRLLLLALCDASNQEIASTAFQVSGIISGPPTDEFVTLTLDARHGVIDEAKNYVALVPIDAMNNIPNPPVRRRHINPHQRGHGITCQPSSLG